MNDLIIKYLILTGGKNKYLLSCSVSLIYNGFP
jgi:hypothetical protein